VANSSIHTHVQAVFGKHIWIAQIGFSVRDILAV